MRATRAPALALVALLVATVLPAEAEAEFFPSVELRCRRLNNGNCSQNTEPDVKVDADGKAYVSAIIGVPGGTNFWRRTAGDTVFRWVGMPEYQQYVTNRGFALGGGDTALAIAPVKNAAGFYNVYVATLFAAGVTVATSRNGGTIWELNYLTAPITADRQWLVADGAETIWLAYVDFQKGGLAVVARSDDGGRIFGPPIPVYEPEDQTRGILFRSRWGSLTLDPATKTLYWPFANVGDLPEAATGAVPQNPLGVKRHVLRMAISNDGGLTWRNRLVHAAPPDVRVDAVFPWMTVDATGNAYALWSTTAAVFMSVSTDRGERWGAPIQVSSGEVRSAVLPTMIGGRAGTVDIGYIGSTSASIDDPNALWDVYFVQSLNATDPVPTLTQVKASDQPVHKGSVCLRGLSCDLPAPAGNPGDRALAEILTIALDLDGYALISSPYDYRGGRGIGSTQSLMMKQKGLARAFDSGIPVIGLSPEPK